MSVEGSGYSFVTVWNDFEMTCQRPSAFSMVK